MDSPRTDLGHSSPSSSSDGQGAAAASTGDSAPRSNGGAAARQPLFANRNFRLFFTGQLISNTGTWLQNVAQGVLVLRLTGSSLMVGVANAALFVPVLLLSLFGGGLA